MEKCHTILTMARQNFIWRVGRCSCHDVSRQKDGPPLGSDWSKRGRHEWGAAWTPQLGTPTGLNRRRLENLSSSRRRVGLTARSLPNNKTRSDAFLRVVFANKIILFKRIAYSTDILHICSLLADFLPTHKKMNASAVLPIC